MSVHQDVIAVSKLYLGPAAEHFIARQCQLHLKIDDASVLNKAHLPVLANWIEVAGVRYMDEAKAKELAKKVLAC